MSSWWGALRGALCRGAVWSSPTVAGTVGRRQKPPGPTDAGRPALRGLCTGTRGPRVGLLTPRWLQEGRGGLAFPGQQGRAGRSKD